MTASDKRHAEEVSLQPLTEQAYGRIRRNILDNVWAPGFQILEKTLAESLQMSRTPVREACLRLQTEGLVEVIPRHGMRVRPVSAEMMSEIYAILSSLESTAAELAARRTHSPETLKALEKASGDMDAALGRDDLQAWAEADERFHRLLVEMSGNQLMSGVISNFWDRAHRARMVTLHLRPKPEASTDEHRAVVEAILRGDAESAREIHRAHRERGAQELTEILQRLRLTQI